jgi:uncharacterized protein YndB with AHSA1/START domain
MSKTNKTATTKNKPLKGKTVTVVKATKAKPIATNGVSTKKAATKKLVTSLSKDKTAKSTKALAKGEKIISKSVPKKNEIKSALKKQKTVQPTKIVKTDLKKVLDKKTKKSDNALNEKPVKAKKNLVVEGIELNKTKSNNKASKSSRSKKKKKGDDDDEPAIDVDDALLAEILETVKPKKKNTKEVKQIRTFVNPMASLTVAQVVKDGKKSVAVAKEPKGKFVLEFVLGTSPAILYEFLTTPSGLSEWFADDVNIHDGVFTFFWDGSEQKALLLDFKEEKFIRFQWVDKPAGSYFEFKIDIDELTGDVSLMVTDFADEGSDLETSKRLWDSQIHTLMHVIGSY